MRTTRSDDEFMEDLCALLRAEGISRLGVADIAARLKCSRRRLYEVAPNKQALLVVVAKRLFDAALRAGFEAAASKSDPAQAIAAYLNVGVVTAATFSPAFLEDIESMPEGRAVFDRYQRERASGLQDIIEAGIRSGHFTPHNAKVATEVALGMAMRLRRPEFLNAADLTLKEAFEEAYDLILNGMLARSRRSSSAKREPVPARSKPVRSASDSQGRVETSRSRSLRGRTRA